MCINVMCILYCVLCMFDVLLVIGFVVLRIIMYYLSIPINHIMYPNRILPLQCGHGLVVCHSMTSFFSSFFVTRRFFFFQLSWACGAILSCGFFFIFSFQ